MKTRSIEITKDSTNHGLAIGSVHKVWSSEQFHSEIADYTTNPDMRLTIKVMDTDCKTIHPDYNVPCNACECCGHDIDLSSLCKICEDCIEMGLHPWKNPKEDLVTVYRGYRLNSDAHKEKLEKERLESLEREKQRERKRHEERVRYQNSPQGIEEAARKRQHELDRGVEIGEDDY